jgi:hypothetical protein
MATIEKRGPFWRVKIRRAGLLAQTKTFDNRTHAQQWARSVESDLDKGIVVDRRTAQRLSLAEVLERYRREVTPTKRGSLDENLRVKAMAQRPFARIRMSALTSSHLAAYRDERLKVVSGATVNREFTVLSHAIDTARREWDVYLPANPCTLVRRPPQGPPPGTDACRAMRSSGCLRRAAMPGTSGWPISWHLPSKQACGGASSSHYSGRTWTSSGTSRSCRSPRTASRAACRFRLVPSRFSAVCLLHPTGASLGSSRKRLSSSPSTAPCAAQASRVCAYTTCGMKPRADSSRRG